MPVRLDELRDIIAKVGLRLPRPEILSSYIYASFLLLAYCLIGFKGTITYTLTSSVRGGVSFGALVVDRNVVVQDGFS